MKLIDRLTGALTVERPGAPEFHDWDSQTGSYTDAAVLIAITDRPEPGVLLTVRPTTLRQHPGQISFPGGRVDPGDASVVAAALREAQEEIGLAPEMVEIAGISDTFRIGTGYAIVPIVGVIPPDLPLEPNPDEVELVFEAPLAFLTDPANHLRLERDWGGEIRPYHAILWGERRIWGATAAMLVNLGRRLGLSA